MEDLPIEVPTEILRDDGLSFYPDISYSEFRKKVAKSRAVGSFNLEELKTYMDKLGYNRKYPSYCKRLENDYPIYREDFFKRNHLPEFDVCPVKSTIGESISELQCSEPVTNYESSFKYHQEIFNDLYSIIRDSYRNGFLYGYGYGALVTMLSMTLGFIYVYFF